MVPLFAHLKYYTDTREGSVLDQSLALLFAPPLQVFQIIYRKNLRCFRAETGSHERDATGAGPICVTPR